MLILGIESSCDETSAAVVDFGSMKVLSNFVASQNDVHARFGGVVPELASRRHLENAIPLLHGALTEANLSINDIDGIAVTHAPGLLGSLLVGIQLAKGLALAINKPLIGVNHLEGHLNAIALERSDVPYPHVGLVVSGGHTSLYLVKKFGEYKLLGATRDDAAGEAFDKVAKLLNLGYPGGPIIDRIAPKGNPKAFHFKAPQFGKHGDVSPVHGAPCVKGERPHVSLDFSFSGVKTAVLLKYREKYGNVSCGDVPPVHGAPCEKGERPQLGEQFILDLAASFQDFVVGFLCDRVISALKETKTETVIVAGGVAANSCLRHTLKERCDAMNIKCFIPPISLCTDNAAMIAYVGGRYLQMGKRSDMSLNAVANMEIGVDL